MIKQTERSRHRAMTLYPDTGVKGRHRTDQEWLIELRDGRDIERQFMAINDLSRYLHVVAYNTLQKRQANYSRLYYMDQESISELARDFVQETLAKVARDKFRLLNQYQGKGKFTSWAAQIINNEISSELRKVDWARSTSLRGLPDDQHGNSNVPSPEAIAITRYNHDSLHQLIAELPPKLCIALTRCVLHEERAATVAEDMGITANAVYMLVHRAKQILHNQLVAQELDLLSV